MKSFKTFNIIFCFYLFVSLFGPILIPSNPICLLDLILSKIFFAPKLLNPSLLINASSSTNLKTLGFGFPYCFKGVIVPTSTKPKPI